MAEQAIRFYGAPWCPDCKRSKQFLNEHRILYEWHDISQDETAREYVQEVSNGKQIIPTIVLSDGSILVESSNAELADKLGIKSKAESQYYELIIIGAGPAGLAAGIYAAREGISTLIVERSGIGGQAGITQEIENYPGFPETISGAELSDRLRKQADRFNVEILAAQSVTSIMKQGDLHAVRVQSSEEYCASAVILATGASYRRLGIPGEEDFIGAGVHFCATCDGPFYKDKDIVAVGGGNSGFQEGLFLTKFAKSVTILEVQNEFRAIKALQDKVAERDDIQAKTETTVEEIRGNKRLEAITVKNVATGETTEMRPGAVFVFIGLLPNTDFSRGTVEPDDYGFIITGESMETNVQGVFAAGDCRRGSTKQISSAVGEGTTAALMARHHLERLGDAIPAPVG